MKTATDVLFGRKVWWKRLVFWAYGKVTDAEMVKVEALTTPEEAAAQRAMWRKLDHDADSMRLIHALRQHEGDSVNILCDNPDPDTEDKNNAVECCGDWTGWGEVRFYGSTLCAALQRAWAERIQWHKSQGDTIDENDPI